MDSSTADDARSSKRARLTPSPTSCDDVVDRISSLDDDVLLRVLGEADAVDAVRAGVLSRRWLGLWTRVPALRFASRPAVSMEASRAEHCAALERYVAFVNGVLARRAQPDCSTSTIELEHLAISYATDSARNLEQLMAASVDAAQGWIRYAFQHGVKSLDVDLRLPLKPQADEDLVHDFGEGDNDGPDFGEDDDDDGPVVTVDDDLLASPEKLASMRLALGGARLQLPVAMKFASLVDLSLERIKIAAASSAGSGAQLLARLVSSATCPCLRKLRMFKLFLPSPHLSEKTTTTMQIDAVSLLELWIEYSNMRSLELRTPSLRVLHIDTCCSKVLTVSAPRLQELAFFQRGYPPRRLKVDGGLPHVRSLKLYLMARRRCSAPSSKTTDRDANNVLLLKRHCRSVTSLEVTLEAEEIVLFKPKDDGDVDMVKTKSPHLPHVTSLTVNVSDMFERHDYGAAVANLLMRFKNLTHLRVHLPFFSTLYYDLGAGLNHDCNRRNQWKSHKVSLPHLQEVELTGLTGTDCEVWFMKAVLASAKSLCRVAVRFNKECWQHEGKMDALERILLRKGMQTSHRDTFTLNACMDLISS